MKKSFVKYTSLAATALILGGAVAPTVNAQSITTPNGAVYTRETNVSGYTKKQGADAIADLMQYYSQETQKANSIVPQIEAQEKNIKDLEGAVQAAKAKQEKAQELYDAAKAKVGDTSYDDAVKAVEDAYEKRVKAAQDKVDAAKKERDNKEAALQTAQSELETAKTTKVSVKVGTKEVSPAVPAQEAVYEDVIGADGEPVKNADGTTVQKLVKEAVPAQEAVYEDVYAEQTPGADSDLIKSLQSNVDTAQTAFNTADAAYQTALSEQQTENNAAEAAKQQGLRQADYDYKSNDQYGEKPYDVAKSELDAAKKATAEAEQNLRNANIQLSVLQNSFAIHTSNAELASAKAAEIALVKNIDANTELGTLSADQKKVLEELKAQGSDAINAQAEKAAANKEQAEKSLNELRKQTDAAGAKQAADQAAASNADAKDPEANKEAKTETKQDAAKKEAKKEEKKADKKDGKLPETGEVLGLGAIASAAVSLLAGLGLVRRKKD